MLDNKFVCNMLLVCCALKAIYRLVKHFLEKIIPRLAERGRVKLNKSWNKIKCGRQSSAICVSIDKELLVESRVRSGQNRG